MEEDEGICPICKTYKHDQRHNTTVDHRFAFIKLAYNENRKSLVGDRHGVILDATAKIINNYSLDFRHKKGKYVTKVRPEQLQLHNKSITYNCIVRNQRRDAIYLTLVELLHSSKYFEIKRSEEIGENEGSFVKLSPGFEYKFEIKFKTDIATCGSHKIPLICSFQTTDNKHEFTIARAFLIHIDDTIEEKATKKKSPFTSQPWKGVDKVIQPTNESYFADKYRIPYKYKRLLAHGLEPFDNMTAEEEHHLREIKQLLQILTKDNYNTFWHILLWLEETGQALMLMKYNMAEVTIHLKNEKYLVLQVPGLAERRPSVIVGDYIKIRLSGDHTVYKGFVSSVHEQTIEISHVDEELIECLRLDPLTSMDVAFMLGRLCFERMHYAVDTLVRTKMVDNLFPTSPILCRNHTTHQLNDSHFINRTICHNSEQREAVNKILNSVHNVPYIVFGPPGTGKSVTIVEAILQIKQRTKKKILVCAPANSACDMLAMKLKECCNTNELLRIHSMTRDRTTIPEELKEYSNIDIEDDEFVKIMSDQLPTYRIVVTTLVLIGKYASSYRPDCVFIDEAAQASEPETDIAVALVTTGKQVVLAGDPKQLGPMTTKITEKFGLGISLLERLMDRDIYKRNQRTKCYNNNFITMLKLNFRSHPEILSIPNELFYNNLLKAMSVEAKMDPLAQISVYSVIKNRQKQLRGHATEFCSVSAKEMREGSSPSYFNLHEANMVVKYVQALHHLNIAGSYQVTEEQIGVVTPYKRQVFKIRDNLKYNGFLNVEVGTTETFQGREKRIIIISTVRAQHSLLLHDRKYNLGFVKHEKRFNVALTRAKSKLIIIGNPLVLRTDAKWLQYMDMCENQGTYVGNHFFKDDDTFRKDVLHRMRRFKAKDNQYHH